MTVPYKPEAPVSAETRKVRNRALSRLFINMRANKPGIDLRDPSNNPWLVEFYEQLRDNSSPRCRDILTAAQNTYGYPWQYTYKDFNGKVWARELMHMALEMWGFLDFEPNPDPAKGRDHMSAVKDWFQNIAGNDEWSLALESEFSTACSRVFLAKQKYRDEEAAKNATG